MEWDGLSYSIGSWWMETELNISIRDQSILIVGGNRPSRRWDLLLDVYHPVCVPLQLQRQRLESQNVASLDVNEANK
jgi:hypothetical protein